VRLAASQVIERPPAEVFRFVATEHFQNHPKWDPAVTSITQTSPGPMRVGMTARLVRTDRGRRIEGTMEVTEYEPVSSFTEVSRFGPFYTARSGDVGARWSGEHEAGAGDRYSRPRGDPVAAAVDEGNLPQDDGQEPSHHPGAFAPPCQHELRHSISINY
jgi:hypothetical protein